MRCREMGETCRSGGEGSSTVANCCVVTMKSVRSSGSTGGELLRTRLHFQPDQ